MGWLITARLPELSEEYTMMNNSRRGGGVSFPL